MGDNQLSNSLCQTCKFKIRRVLSAAGLSIVDQEGEEIKDTEDLELISDTCYLLRIDLDHVVLSCSAYEFKNVVSNTFFKKDAIFNWN